MIITKLTFTVIICLAFMIGLTIVYFSKSRINNQENKIYRMLLILNIVGLSLHLLADFVSYNYDKIPIVLSTIVFKNFLAYYFLFGIILLAYLLIIAEIKNKNLYNKILIIISILVYVVIFSVPQHLHREVDKMIFYTDGLDVQVIFVLSAILTITIMAILVLKINTVSKKKIIPLLIFMIGATISIIIQKAMPDIVLTDCIESIICCMMYFTIENPDMKLLEEIHKAKEISDSANEEKTLFVYNMAQEIRSITGKIDDDADLILDSKEYDEIYDSARDIKAKTSEFTSMTNEILDVSTIDSASIKTYNSKYNVKNLIKQMVNVYGDICKNKELKFRTNIDHDIPEELYGDSINLKEVLNTVLSNSTKYTEKGYVELSVNTIIKNDICRLIFTIEDSGKGIKSEDINKIKIDNKSLSKANKLITMMNGTMLISSDYGIGTKVKIILDQKIGEVAETEVSKYESNFDNISILSVDDSEAGLKIIEKLLKGTKINLDIASNGKECIDKIKIGKYDLILLDEELSQISGLELMKKIKEIRNFNIPVILLTKDNSYEYNEEYLKNGFSDYILKPLKKEELLDKINKYTKEDKK